MKPTINEAAYDALRPLLMPLQCRNGYEKSVLSALALEADDAKTVTTDLASLMLITGIRTERTIKHHLASLALQKFIIPLKDHSWSSLHYRFNLKQGGK